MWWIWSHYHDFMIKDGAILISTSVLHSLGAAHLLSASALYAELKPASPFSGDGPTLASPEFQSSCLIPDHWGDCVLPAASWVGRTLSWRWFLLLGRKASALSACCLPSESPKWRTPGKDSCFLPGFPKDGFDLTREAVTKVTVASSVFCIENL